MNEQNRKQSDDIQARFAKSDWDHVALYRNGVLVWGAEP